ncbi:RNA-binding protein [Alisedimentitalea sp. MJ-SS2]|uniref:RNA-binding protein n=1 Tax=Aliisedimentitalea sp. MJ-SS2 TaxID=3049795 RepID=UPI00290CF0FE|nr:RNA-binding protein [Alisedimentitalea sp. MJ-SS2]MDU8927875.1 RNA-binding protein [Alisedimentitalea sp. MJ-SS2]
MGRGGQAKARDDGAVRKCIATGELLPKEKLVRFVVGPDAQIVPDIRGKLPGRGIWVSAERDALDKAVAKKLFARAAKQAVELPQDLVSQVEGLLVRRLIDLIAMARKSGQAVSGFEKVKGWLAGEDVKVLLQSSDGSERGKSKLWTPEGARFVGLLTSDELGQAFGRETVVHAAIGAGGLAPRVVEEAARLKALRVSEGGTDRRKEKKRAR